MALTQIKIKNSATGSVSRTIDSAFEDTVSAADFGALGNNSNDDTAELQAALNAAAGKTLLIPKGIYLISATLIIPEGTRILGSGKADISEEDYTKGTVIKTTGSGNAQVWTDIASGNDTAQTPCLVAGGNGIYIENLTVLTNSNNWSIGIFYPCVKQCSISKVSMRGFTNACLYLDATWSNLNTTLTGSTLSGATASTLIKTSTGMNEFYAEDFIFRSSTNGVSDFGIKIQGSTRNPDSYNDPSNNTNPWIWGWGGASDIVFNSGRTSGISIDGAVKNAAKAIQGQRFIAVDSRVSTNGVLVNIDRANRVDFISGYGETVTNSKIKFSHRTGIVNFLATAYRGTVNYLNTGGSTTTHGTLGSSRIVDADDSSILDLTVYGYEGLIRSKFFSITESPSNLAIDGKANETGLQFRASDIIPRDNGSATNLATDLGDASFSFRDVYARGILFDGATGSSHRLDDYEEGYWSPTAVDGMTLHLQDSSNVPCRRYVKIGKIVTCFFDINWDSGNSSANFATRFAGLPFSVETGGHQAAAAACIGFFNGAETDMLVAHVVSGLLKFWENGDALYSYSESAGDRIAGFFTYTTT